MNWRILLIDDHAALQVGLEDILSTNLRGCEFGAANTAQQAIDEVRKSHWDIAVVDLSIPGRGGIELIRSLKEEQPRLRVLVYSMHSEEQFGVRALRAGASGYLTKDKPGEEVAVAVRSIMETGAYITPSLAAALAQSAATGVEETSELLSDREYEVLRKMAAGKTPTNIAEELALSVKTVSTYRARMLEKLNLRTTADLIRYAVDHRIAE